MCGGVALEGEDRIVKPDPVLLCLINLLSKLATLFVEICYTGRVFGQEQPRMA